MVYGNYFRKAEEALSGVYPNLDASSLRFSTQENFNVMMKKSEQKK
jgi:hypothetical protein